MENYEERILHAVNKGIQKYNSKQQNKGISEEEKERLKKEDDAQRHKQMLLPLRLQSQEVNAILRLVTEDVCPITCNTLNDPYQHEVQRAKEVIDKVHVGMREDDGFVGYEWFLHAKMLTSNPYVHVILTLADGGTPLYVLEVTQPLPGRVYCFTNQEEFFNQLLEIIEEVVSFCGPMYFLKDKKLNFC